MHVQASALHERKGEKIMEYGSAVCRDGLPAGSRQEPDGTKALPRPATNYSSENGGPVRAVYRTYGIPCI